MKIKVLFLLSPFSRHLRDINPFGEPHSRSQDLMKKRQIPPIYNPLLASTWGARCGNSTCNFWDHLGDKEKRSWLAIWQIPFGTRKESCTVTYLVFLSILWVVWQSVKVWLAAKILIIPSLLRGTERQEFPITTWNLLTKLGKSLTCLLPQFPICNNWIVILPNPRGYPGYHNKPHTCFWCM